MLEQIAAAVRESSRIMLEADNIKAATSMKLGHANFVTKYDKRLQQDLFERLGSIFPKAAFMGEEEIGKRYKAEGYLFVVDPIDGTTNFIKGYHASSVSVGLLKDGEPVLGVIYNPYRDEMFTAEKGNGAFLNGQPIHVSEETLSDSLVLFGTAPYYEELWERSFDVAKVLFTHSLDVRRSGSAAIELCDVACGRAGVYFELRLSPWDYAAGSLIVKEAGGHVRGAEGEKLQFARPQGVIACGGGISIDALLQIMERVE